jgi:hypothetical protein
MKNQPLFLGFQSALVVTCLLNSLQGYAGDAYKTTEPTQKAEASQQSDTTQSVFKVITSGSPVYSINGKENPELTLKRGVSYTFELKTTGHPFWIKTKNSTGKTNAYEAGVTGNGTERGTLTFAVPADAPALLHYNCEVHDMMNGAIHITD